MGTQSLHLTSDQPVGAGFSWQETPPWAWWPSSARAILQRRTVELQAMVLHAEGPARQEEQGPCWPGLQTNQGGGCYVAATQQVAGHMLDSFGSLIPDILFLILTVNGSTAGLM